MDDFQANSEAAFEGCNCQHVNFRRRQCVRSIELLYAMIFDRNEHDEKAGDGFKCGKNRLLRTCSELHRSAGTDGWHRHDDKG